MVAPSVDGRGWGRLAVDFHVLSQGAGMRVRLVTAAHFAVVRLVARVDVGVLLSVAAVGEFSVASVKFTFKWLLPWKEDSMSTSSKSSTLGPMCTKIHRLTL